MRIVLAHLNPKTPHKTPSCEYVTDKRVSISLDSITLDGDLSEPPLRKGVQTKKLVIFAHGSGSSRLSPRNRFVAQFLQDKGFATLLFDLLTEKEDQNYEMRFDIELLAKRLVDATNWISQNLNSKVAIGYFGASTGAAAALIASTRFGSDRVRAIVSRGGRVDMAGPYLSKVVAPTLLIVGQRDENVLELNRSALNALSSSTKKLTIIPTATHLFEEPGTLDQVAKHATDWFEKYL